MMQWQCSGCRATFGLENRYIQHLLAGQRPECEHAREEYRRRVQVPYQHDLSTRRPSQEAHKGPSTSHAPSANDNMDIDAEPSPVPFEGDMFGNDYRDEEFPFGDDDAEPRILETMVRGAPGVQETSDDEDDESEEAVGCDVLEPPFPEHPRAVSHPGQPHTARAHSEIPSPTPSVPSTPTALHSPPSELSSGQACTSHGRTRSPDAAPCGDNASHERRASSHPPGADPQGDAADAPGGLNAALHDQLRRPPTRVKHFGGRAGAPVNPEVMRAAGYKLYGEQIHGSVDNPYAPFCSQLDADIAHWAKLRGPTSNAFSELMAIKGLVEKLGLSYKTANELNNIIDQKLPRGRPSFARYEASVMGESFEMYARPLMDCLVALYSNAEHVRYLCFAPERHYADDDQVIRLYHDLHTGKWWWSVQKQLEAKEPGATVLPVIISSDKTQVTLFRNKTAYPVYVTIGNLPKSIRQKPGRQGQILLAYLPTSRLDHIASQAQRRRVLANMFHACMDILLRPLQSAGVDGVIMTSADGVSRRCHPILAAYVGDYPEQCLVTCTYNGDCPICQTEHFDLEQFPLTQPFRDFEATCEAVKSIRFGKDCFVRACNEVNIKPVQRPFWQDLPYTDIFQSITSDVLHQLYQGVFKHLVSWLKDACGAAEIDARVSRLPPNHSIRVFYKGISNLSRVTGGEHRQISRFLLGVIVDTDLPGGRETTSQLVRATRALLDFTFLAQYPIHSSETLSAMETALETFHDNRDVFVALGIRSGFNIPKLHALAHYIRCIKLFGTTDNYNTETPERLHIDFTKDAYRATNHKDEYPQMTRWLERREKIVEHKNYVLWRLQQADIGPCPLTAHQVVRWHPPDLDAPLHIKMTRHPTCKVPLHDVTSPAQYGARFFIPALARFVVQWRHPDWSARRVEYHAEDFITPVKRLPVFHRVKFWNEAVYGKETVDSLHVHPRRIDDDGDIIVPARFDTALVRIRNIAEAAVPGEPSQDGPDGEVRVWSRRQDLKDTRVAQVRVVFTLPDSALDYLFPTLPPQQRPPTHLAYIEWFSPFRARDQYSGMYKVSRSMQNGDCVASIIPVSLIERSVHLIPKWPRQVPTHWTSENVLDQCSTFYVNPFKDPHTYFNVY